MKFKFKDTVVWYDVTWLAGEVYELDDVIAARLMRAEKVEKVVKTVAATPPPPPDPKEEEVVKTEDVSDTTGDGGQRAGSATGKRKRTPASK